MSETTFMKLLTLMLLLSSTYYSRVLADFLRGSTVTTGSPWRSPGGIFGFGFVMPESSSTRNFNFAIWYDIDPKKTVVWMAMANGQLVQVSENAKLELKAEGGLSVTAGNSSVPFWQTNPGQCCAESAALLENGNLIVLRKDKKIAWQIFDSPTNNLLPEQQLRTQGNPSLGYTRLISRVSGAYQLVLNSGQVLLKNLKLEIPQKYWSIANPTLNSTMTCLDDETGEHGSFPFTTQLDRAGSMSSQDYALDYDDANVLRRLTLDDDSNLRIYSFGPKNKSGSWSIVWQAVMHECDVFGTCGPFALCTYRPTKTCSCPPGFHRVDPNDESKGCDYNIPLGGCQNSSNSVKLVQVNRADYYFNDYNFDSTIKSLEKCKDTCMQDCKCLAAAYKYDGTGLCFLKGSSNKLYNGKQTLNEINMVFMKLSSLDTSAADDQHDPFLADANATVSDQVMPKINKRTVYLSRHLHSIILSVAIVELGLFATGAAVVAAVWKKISGKKWEEMTAEIEGLPTKFTYRQLQDATENFCNELGSGGFGSVYRGNIPEKGGDTWPRPKADVYSFGMLLLDTLSGKRKALMELKQYENAPLPPPGEWYFPIYAFQKYMTSELESIADPNLASGSVDWEQFETALKIALWYQDPGSRPAMSRVVQILEGKAEAPAPPFPDAGEGN
ncbi:hypothetical protein SELMODRAFT_405893 [Selaginella moellendorffii]|uniref:Non-specific serine/threonine protein kinase n=1 Tax=Selaginella moellendorffii TaxID=88036 RepID=D8R008_SELML|nr:hypothetical protein SELMODRAFT_405893 [Selaginella moellendorffii]